jgi:hypothetical protein
MARRLRCAVAVLVPGGIDVAHVLETGHIYFFYRPRVEHVEAKSFDDIQRFHLVLSPRGKHLWRLLTIGRKRMPAIQDGGERAWAFVQHVAQRPAAVEDDLAREVYETKTRGERLQPEARPAGEGVYALVDHVGHAHLAYELEFPRQPGNVQSELHVEPRGSYVVSVRNPETPAPPQAGLRSSKAVELPPELQQRFRGRRFAEVTPEFLDHEGAELVLIGATKAPEQELGLALEPEDEREAEAAIFRDLRLERDRHPLEPLFQGEWR